MSSWLDLLEEKLGKEVLDQAARESLRGKDPADFLLEQSLISPQALLSFLSAYYRVPSILLERYLPEEKALEKVTEEVARRFMIFPLFQLYDRLYAAVTDPGNLEALDYLRHFTGLTIEPVVATRSAIESSINRFFITRDRLEKRVGEIAAAGEKEAEEAAKEVRVEDKDAPVIKLVDYIFSQAAHMRASDIHLEPFQGRISMRYRVDGVLHEFPPPPNHLYRAVVSRVKILASLDIAERRLPQDGRARIRVDNHDYDLRISIIPGLHGEGVVIRILDTSGPSKNLEDLGFGQKVLGGYKKLIVRPNGILLITGPTGSGKTTTLYATLRKIISPKKKIITLEDPVEYQVDGVEQIQINPDIGFTFAAGLRSVLRHDPDVVMLGEIRDLESAEIAIRSSLTGHLVLSTLHTNDAPTAVTRLVDMGIEPYLVFSSLVGVLAQRLVRRLCDDCKKPVSPDESGLSSLSELKLQAGLKIFQPAGCPSCGNLGYKGRVAIGEFLEITAPIRRLPPDRITPGILREAAADQGFMNLRESAVQAMLAGLTSPEEVFGVTVPEG